MTYGEAYDEALRKIAALERENTDLRMMAGAAKMRVGLLESLVRDMFSEWCATVDDYYAGNLNRYYERMAELGIEVGE